MIHHIQVICFCTLYILYFQRLNFTKCVYNLSHHSAGGYHYHHELSLNDGAEFLGYYYPADEIYRIDE